MRKRAVRFPWITVIYMGLLGLTLLLVVQFPKNRQTVVTLEQLDHVYFLEEPPVRKVLVDLGLGDMALEEIKKELGNNGPRADISKCNVYLAIRGDTVIDKIWIAIEYPLPNQNGTGTSLVAIEEKEGHFFIGDNELTRDHYAWIQRLTSTMTKSYKVALSDH